MDPKLLDLAREALRSSFLSRYPDKLSQLERFLDLAVLRTFTPPAVVLRPIESGWEVGPEGSTRLFRRGVPKGLQVVHALLDGAPEIRPLGVRPNALRERISAVRRWAERINCPPLAAAARCITVSDEGVARYEPPCGATRWVTK